IRRTDPRLLSRRRVISFKPRPSLSGASNSSTVSVLSEVDAGSAAVTRRGIVRGPPHIHVITGLLVLASARTSCGLVTQLYLLVRFGKVLPCTSSRRINCYAPHGAASRVSAG